MPVEKSWRPPIKSIEITIVGFPMGNSKMPFNLKYIYKDKL